MFREEKRFLDIDGLSFECDAFNSPDGARINCIGPLPGSMMFTSFECPTDSSGHPSWEMVDAYLSRAVIDYLKKYPERWDKYYGENGLYETTDYPRKAS